MNIKKHAVLFKSTDDCEESEDPYVRHIENLGVKCHLIPVIAFEYINSDQLKSKLSNPSFYSGIIFLSPRCVEAVKLAMSDVSVWKNILMFAVGERTAKDISSSLGIKPFGEQCGSAAELSKYVLSQKIITKPLLLPVGNLSKNDISGELRAGGLETDSLVVYRTTVSPNLAAECRKVFDENDIGYTLFFSPSGAESAYNAFNELCIDIAMLKFGAIGPTTEDAVRKFFSTVDFVSSKPTPVHYAEALQGIL